MNSIKTGEFIAKLRKEKNLTQKELAEKLYVSDRAVSKWERGLSMPDISILEALGQYLDVSVSEILKGEKIKEMTKKKYDEIVKDSIPFYQKKYFKNKFTKIIIGVITIITILYFLILCIGETNYGSVSWKVFDSEYSIDVPSFSSKMHRKNSEKFLDALIKYDYNTINEILTYDPYKFVYDKDLAIDNLWKKFTNNLKSLQKAGVTFTNYKYTFFYHGGYGYVCDYDLGFIYDEKKYSLSLQLLEQGKMIRIYSLGYGDTDSLKINNPYPNLKQINYELYQKIEETFNY